MLCKVPIGHSKRWHAFVSIQHTISCSLSPSKLAYISLHVILVETHNTNTSHFKVLCIVPCLDVRELWKESLDHDIRWRPTCDHFCDVGVPRNDPHCSFVLVRSLFAFYPTLLWWGENNWTILLFSFRHIKFLHVHFVLIISWFINITPIYYLTFEVLTILTNEYHEVLKLIITFTY